MTRYPLAGCVAKLQRAEAHIDTLHAKIGTFLKGEPVPYGLIPEVDVQASKALWRLRVIEEPPLEWSTITGDYVQNLRAALDHLIWVLVKANGFEPTNSNAFPIFDVKPPDKSSHALQWRGLGNPVEIGTQSRTSIIFSGSQPYPL